MKYTRTKDGIYYVPSLRYQNPKKCECEHGLIINRADDIVELFDEIVLIENGDEHNIVYLQEAYDRIDECYNQGNYEPRLIGRIKVGFDKKAVAEWKENEQGLYDWILL